MPHPRFTSEELARRGEELWDREIRRRVDTEENVGRLVSINIETGDYAVGDDLIATSRKLQARHPGAAIWTKRIGYDAVFAVGGTLHRTAP